MSPILRVAGAGPPSPVPVQFSSPQRGRVRPAKGGEMDVKGLYKLPCRTQHAPSRAHTDFSVSSKQSWDPNPGLSGHFPDAPVFAGSFTGNSPARGSGPPRIKGKQAKTGNRDPNEKILPSGPVGRSGGREGGVGGGLQCLDVLRVPRRADSPGGLRLSSSKAWNRGPLRGLPSQAIGSQ